MPRVTVSGYYGFDNAGDEAMLSGIIRSISERMSGVEFLVLSANPAQTSSEHRVEAIRRTDLAGIVRELKRTDLLISGGGSLLQDVTSERSLGYYLGIIYLGRILSRRVMLYGHGIGPIRRSIGRSMVRWVVNGVDLVTVRDRESAAELERLGVTRPPVVITADPALALDLNVDPHEGLRLLRESNDIKTEKPLVGISLRPLAEKRDYIRLVATAADGIAERFDAGIVFVPMQWPYDKEISEQAASLMRFPVHVLRRRHSFVELLQIIGCLKLMAGMRLHSLIFAAMAGVPVLGLACDPKINSFLETIGEKPITDMVNLSVEEILLRVEGILRSPPRDGNAVMTEMQEMRRMALRNADLAVELLSGALPAVKNRG